METQITSKQHLVQQLSHLFRSAFTKHYKQYISKDLFKKDQLVENIIKKTVGLQSEYVFKMADQFNVVDDKEIINELKKKREITLANQAIDDVKVMFTALHLVIHKMYQEFLDPQDLKDLNEDLAKLIINSLIQQDIYKVLICLQRIDNFDSDKDLRAKYALLKGVKTYEFGIDPYFNMCDPICVVSEGLKKYGVDLETQRELLQNPTVQKLDEIDEAANMKFKEYLKTHKQQLETVPQELRAQIILRAKIKPYQKSVVKFREIMMKACSPLEKLFLLFELKICIHQDIQDYWGSLIYDTSKLVLNRDEQTSILLFIICKAEIPDLISQMRLITEFTSQDIQDVVDGWAISETFTIFYTTIKWLSSLDQFQLNDRSYLLKANVLIKEDQLNQRYDKIHIGDAGDNFDPFTMVGSNPVTNSYIDEKSFIIEC